MALFDNIYVKDRIDPTVPGSSIELDVSLVSESRASYRWLSYTNARRGIPVPADLPGDDRPKLVAQLWAEARSWLAAG
jgi:hypothetical protein